MKILFQGDSITDGCRDYRNYHLMGNSYPKYASALIAKEFPDVAFEFINQGIASNRTDNLFDRLYTDAIAFQPDVISILIGINDVWARYSSRVIETTDAQIEANYRAILERLKRQTNAKIVMLSPYLLDSEDKEYWRHELDRIQPMIRALADEFADVFVPLHELFREALKTQPTPNFYSPDGVHPNDNGAKFIGEQYFNAIVPLLRDCVQ